MSAISNFLSFLRSAIYAIDVRDGIADAIEQCYNDVNNPTLKTEALEAALQTKIDEGEMAALTIGDGTITGAKLANGTIPKAKLDPSITFDADPALDTTSTNAIQNKVVAGAISTLQADLGAVEDSITADVVSKNLIDPSKLTVGRLGSDGTVAANMTAYKTSDYIPVEAGKTYVFGCESTTTPGSLALMGYSGFGYYDTSKTWVADSLEWANNGKVALTIEPESDGYVRLSGGADKWTEGTSRFIMQEGTELDGWEEYFNPYKDVIAITKNDIVQETGQNETKAMSQKAVTDLIENSGVSALANIITLESPVNLYDKEIFTVGKYFNNGSELSNATWAHTGKIPVKPNTQYNISIDPDCTVKPSTSVYAFNSSGTYIDRITITSYVYSHLLAFVTPSNCAFVAMNVNWTNHTETELIQ